ncbi:MAG: uroporphyrinogen-III synthase, partial [Ginsengibacter sp.]
ENINAVFTSMNAVEALRKFVPSKSSWRVFCIGNTTKKLVKDIFGEGNLSGIGNNATALAENIVSDKGIKKVYFFCGDQRRDELPRKLKDNNIDIEELIVYKTIETAEKISKVYDGILFFSPSAVHSFFLKNLISDETQVFAIGTTTADALKPFTQQPVIIADFPGKKNLVEQAINYFSKNKFLKCNK